MTANYVHIMFGDAARSLQEQDGSREAYAAMERGANGWGDMLEAREAEFIAARDSFYMASVTQDGWPYVQHRGGPRGFLKLIDERHIGFADVRGNRQFLSSGNIAADDRVALILVDYPARRRLKLIGHARRTTVAEDPDLVMRLMPEGWEARPQAAFVIAVTAFDWNCPQHITPRWTAEELMQIRKDAK
jgi:predicted pyridoxine 5'-phosphate oxidase superfamily flavin-nucleotide-binding protein